MVVIPCAGGRQREGRFLADVPTPVHFHDKDVVVVYLEDGSLRSTTPDGQSDAFFEALGLVRLRETIQDPGTRRRQVGSTNVRAFLRTQSPGPSPDT